MKMRRHDVLGTAAVALLTANLLDGTDHLTRVTANSTAPSRQGEPW